MPQASHDDGTCAHVEEAIGLSMCIAEFPTTFEAAAAAHRFGMAVVMGAPNVVRGGPPFRHIFARGLPAGGGRGIFFFGFSPPRRVVAALLPSPRKRNTP